MALAESMDRRRRKYAADLEGNLQSLLDRLKSGRYRAPPVRRVHIPRGEGPETRPIGIPTFEDKVAQRAVAMVIEQVYEQELYNFSYGFRPGRTAHQALEALRGAAWKRGGGWVVEVDIKKFFDSVNHTILQEVLRRRIGDRLLLRLLGKWLNAGVVEGHTLSRPEEGTPQGGVISPLLANILLHDVFDAWFVRDVAPVLHGKAVPVRYADDIAVLFENERDARRFLAVLPKRFGKCGLTLHPDKTRLVPFRRPARVERDEDGPGTSTLLGFTLYRARSRRGTWVVKLQDGQGPLPPRAPPNQRVVPAASARLLEGTARHARQEGARALRVLRRVLQLGRDWSVCIGSATRSSGRGGVRYNAAPNDTSRGRQCNGS
jgi:RNA-directed DNA polymerase